MAGDKYENCNDLFNVHSGFILPPPSCPQLTQSEQESLLNFFSPPAPTLKQREALENQQFNSAIQPSAQAIGEGLRASQSAAATEIVSSRTKILRRDTNAATFSIGTFFGDIFNAVSSYSSKILAGPQDPLGNTVVKSLNHIDENFDNLSTNNLAPGYEIWQNQ